VLTDYNIIATFSLPRVSLAGIVPENCRISPTMTNQTPSDPKGESDSTPQTLAWWTGTPLYLRILWGLALGAVVGMLVKHHNQAYRIAPADSWLLAMLYQPSMLILKVLGALAPPLILVAVLDTLIKARLAGGVARKMAGLLLLNTVVAILIGLFVANVIRPGAWSNIELPAKQPVVDSEPHVDPVKELLKNVPESLLEPLVDNNVIGVILIGVAFGVALRRLPGDDRATAQSMVGVAFKAIVIVLHWVIELVPIGVFGIVSHVVGTAGFGPFKALGAFVLAVLIGLLLQLAWYLIRIGLGTWVRPMDVLAGMKDAMVMAFSTDSSTATMPVTYACLKDNVGIREESARMGALVGTNFNNDGTALYEAMAALFVSQLIGLHLGLWPQVLVVLTSIVASIGAAGIPEAGLVTMTLVFRAVGLPPEYIGMLLTVDWFLDRSRTVINMMGDVNVSCMLDGRTPPAAEQTAPDGGRIALQTE
jgi:Na+/H+-dicarboxylate symporter